MTDRELLELIAAQVNTLTTNMDNVVKNIETLTKDVSELKEGQDRVESKLDQLEGTNAANHIATKTRLSKISNDLDFLTHKEFQTEKEIYDIKQRLIKQRRNTR